MQTKDLDTLFIVAGCAGAGKSTIIRSAYLLDIPLFGEDFHQKFLTTCRSPNFEELKKYSEAREHGSIFQARHLTNLERDPSPPDSLLLHVDLKGVVRLLGHTAASNRDKKRIEEATNNPPISKTKMLNPKVCNLMTSSYLRNPLFKRFKKILINTVFTEFTDNAQQLLGRKFPPGNTKKIAKEWRNLGFKTAESAKEFHNQAYKAWERNLHILKPERIFFTKVDSSGDLLINNNIACKNWKEKAL